MPKNSSPPGLDSLVYPESHLEFMSQNWATEPKIVHGLKDSISALTSLPFLQSLDSMLESWTDTVKAYRPGVADEANSITVTSTEARKLYADKKSLLFNDVQKKSIVLQDWLAHLHADLGLPAMTYGRCIVYATPDGTGTALHFDQNINFVIQLSGTKTWTLAPNTHVTHPSQRHTMGLPLDPELASYTEEQMPTQMPDNSTSVTLSAGSMLFVPQGYWHSTEAAGEAMSLNFTFSQPSWVDVFTAALRSRLLLSPEWRSLADGVSSRDPELRELARDKLDLLLAELKDDLPHWEARDILDSTEGEF